VLSNWMRSRDCKNRSNEKVLSTTRSGWEGGKMKKVSTIYVAYSRNRSHIRQSMFIPSFTRTQNGKSVYSLPPLVLTYLCRRRGNRKILSCMVASIPGILSDLNFFVDVILAYYYSQIFVCRHISKGSITYLRNVPLSCIVVTNTGTHLADSCDTVSLHNRNCYWL
jgi:hypothetical protein